MQQVFAPISTDEPPPSRPSGLLLVRIVAFFSVLIPIAVGFILIMLQVSKPETRSIGQIGQSYAKQTMVWNKGPVLQGTYPIRMGDLARALRAHVPASVDNRVPIQALIKQYGVKPRIDLVVLTGVFNTLPPDEGVTEPGTAIVLVDAVTEACAFYLAD